VPGLSSLRHRSAALEKEGASSSVIQRAGKVDTATAIEINPHPTRIGLFTIQQ
jgi:hypothetical protein